MAEATPEPQGGISALIQDLERLRARYIVSASKSQSRASVNASFTDTSPLSGNAVATVEAPVLWVKGSDAQANPNYAASRSARIRNMLRNIATKQGVTGRHSSKMASIKSPAGRAGSLKTRGMVLKSTRSKQASPGSPSSSPRLIPTASNSLLLAASPAARSWHESKVDSPIVQGEDDMHTPLLALPHASHAPFSPIRSFSLASAEVAGSATSPSRTASTHTTTSHTSSAASSAAQQQVVIDLSFGGEQLLVTGPPMHQRIDVFPDGTVSTIHTPVHLIEQHSPRLIPAHAHPLALPAPPARPSVDAPSGISAVLAGAGSGRTSTQSPAQPRTATGSTADLLDTVQDQQQQVEVAQLQAALKAAQEAHTEALQAATAQHKAVMRQMEQEHQVALAGVEQRLTTRIATLQADRQQGEQQLQQLRQAHQQEVQTLEEQLEAAAAQLAAAAPGPGHLPHEEELVSQVATLKAQADEHKQERARLQAELGQVCAAEATKSVSLEHVSSLEQRLEAQSCAASVLAEAHQALQQEVQQMREQEQQHVEAVRLQAQTQAQQLSAQIEELCQAWSGERQELEERCAAAQQQAHHLGGELAAAQQALQEQQGMVETLAAELQKARDNLTALQAQTSSQVLEVRQELLEEQARCAALQLASDQVKQQATAQAAVLAQQILQLEQQVEAEVEARKAAQSLCDQAQRLNVTLEDEKQQLVGQLSEAAERCARLEDQLAAAHAEIEASDAHLRGVVYELQSVHASSFEDLKAARAGLVDLQQQLDQSQEAVAGLRAQLGRVLDEHEQMVGLMEVGRQQCSVLQQQLDCLTSAAAAVAAAASQAPGPSQLSLPHSSTTEVPGGDAEGVGGSTGGSSTSSESVAAAQLQLQAVTVTLNEYASQQGGLQLQLSQVQAQWLASEQECQALQAALAAAGPLQQRVHAQEEQISWLQQQLRCAQVAEEAATALLAQQLDSLREELTQLHVTKAQQEADAASELSDLATSSTAALSELSQELAVIRRQLVEVSNGVEVQQQSSRQHHEQRVAAAEERAEQAEQQVATVQERAAAAEALLTAAQARAHAAEEQMEAASVHHSAALEQAATAYGQISHTQDQLLAAQHRVAELEAELQAATLGHGNQAEPELSPVPDQQQAALCSSLQAEVNGLHARVNQLEEQLAESQAQQQEQAAALAEAHQRAHDAQLQLQQLPVQAEGSSSNECDSDTDSSSDYDEAGDDLVQAAATAALPAELVPAGLPDPAAKARVDVLTAQVASLQQQLQHQVELCSQLVLEKADMQMRWQAAGQGAHSWSPGAASQEAALRGQIAGLEAHVQQLKEQVQGLQLKQQAWMQAAGHVPAQSRTDASPSSSHHSHNPALMTSSPGQPATRTASSIHSYQQDTTGSWSTPRITPHLSSPTHVLPDVQAHVTVPCLPGSLAPGTTSPLNTPKQSVVHSPPGSGPAAAQLQVHPMQHVPEQGMVHVTRRVLQGSTQQVHSGKPSTDTARREQTVSQSSARQGLPAHSSRPAARLPPARHLSNGGDQAVRSRSQAAGAAGGRGCAVSSNIAATAATQHTNTADSSPPGGQAHSTWGLEQLDQALHDEVSSLLDDIASQCAHVDKVEAMLDALELYASAPAPLDQPPPPAVRQVVSQQGLGMLQQLQASVQAAQVAVGRVQDMLAEPQHSNSGQANAGAGAGAGQDKPAVGTRVGYGAQFQKHRVLAVSSCVSSAARSERRTMQVEFAGRIDTFKAQLQRAEGRVASVLQLVSSMVLHQAAAPPRSPGPELHIHVHTACASLSPAAASHSHASSPAAQGEGVAWQAYLALCRAHEDAEPSSLHRDTVGTAACPTAAASTAAARGSPTLDEPAGRGSQAYERLLADALRGGRSRGPRPAFSLSSAPAVPNKQSTKQHALQQLKALRRMGSGTVVMRPDEDPEVWTLAAIQHEDMRMRALAQLTNDMLDARNNDHTRGC